MGSLDGAGCLRGGEPGQHAREPGPLHRHRLGGRARAAVAGGAGAAPGPAASGACLAVPMTVWRGWWIPAAVLPLPRGIDLSFDPPRRRPGRSGAFGGRRPRLRVRRPAAEVALAGAQPLGLPDPGLPGFAAGVAGAGAPAHRAGPDPGRVRRRLGTAEAAGDSRPAALDTATTARAAPGAGGTAVSAGSIAAWLTRTSTRRSCRVCARLPGPAGAARLLAPGSLVPRLGGQKGKPMNRDAGPI